MFPEALHDAEAPAKPLPEKHFHGLRCFRVRNGSSTVTDHVSATENADRQVAVLRQRIRSKPSRLKNSRLPESADSAGNYRDTVEQVKCAAVEILAGDVFNGLPFGKHVHLISHFYIAGNRPHFFTREHFHQAGNSIRLQ